MTNGKHITEVIAELWERKETIIRAGDMNMEATLKQPFDNWFDIMLRNGTTGEIIGYITLTRRDEGIYDIITHPGIVQHPEFGNTYIGMEVNKKYQHRGFGQALLSLGVGVVQRDFKKRGGRGKFEVLATGLGGINLIPHKPFGFEIFDPPLYGFLPQVQAESNGFKIYDPSPRGRYTNPHKVPEIMIKI